MPQRGGQCRTACQLHLLRSGYRAEGTVGTGYGTVYRFGVHVNGVPVSVPAAQDAQLSGAPAMSVTIHDVAPATQARCQQLIAQIERINVLPLTLLVVPRYHHRPSTPQFERWLEARLHRGDELALHGLTHLDDEVPVTNVLDRLRRRWYTTGEGEFAALGHDAARRRLDAGLQWFAERAWPLRGFVAPAWLLGAAAWSALCTRPFDYTCTLTRLVRLPRQAVCMRALHGRSIVYSTRAAWRQSTSLLWNDALARYHRHKPWMRFELHPDDVSHAAVREAVMRMIAAADAAGREALTLGGVIDRLS
jgi:predicted deacetylase